MWYDATSAAGTLEDPNASKVAGKVGYAYAPVNKTEYSGWLWTWAWAHAEDHQEGRQRLEVHARGRPARSTRSWSASSSAGPGCPSGKRASTYEIPEYKESAAAFADVTLESIENADPANPGVQPRPTVGVQFVGIPEFADLGTKVSQEVSAAIAGSRTVDQALNDGQKLAEDVATKYQGS